MPHDLSSIQLQGARDDQQDRLITRRAADGSLLVLVADGLGGHPHGEWAADSAISAAAAVLFRPPGAGAGADAMRQTIAQAFAAADQAVRASVPAKPWDPAATTLICAVFGEDRVWLGSLGDSLIIRQRETMEIVNAPQRNLHAVVGINFENASLFHASHTLQPGETWLFASDGIDTPELLAAASRALTQPTARTCAEDLAAAVIEAAGEYQDNVTAVVVRVAGGE